MPALLMVIAHLGTETANASTPHTTSELPWHLADLHIDIGKHKGVKSLSVQYYLFDDLPEKGNSIFLGILSTKVHSARCYAGVTTQAFAVGTPKKHVAIESPGWIFTQFGTKVGDRIMADGQGHAMVGDHEGEHISVRRNATVSKGLYTYTLKKKKAEGGDDSMPRVDAIVTREFDGKQFNLGSLAFDTESWSIDRAIGSFCESAQGWDASEQRWHPAEKGTSDGIRPFRYAIGNWRVNGDAVDVKSIVVSYPCEVPQRAVASHLKSVDTATATEIAKAIKSDDVVVIEVHKMAVVRSGEEAQPIVAATGQPASYKSIINHLK